MSDTNERSVASAGSVDRALQPAVWAILSENGQYRLPEIADGAKVCRFYGNDRYVPLYAEEAMKRVVRIANMSVEWIQVSERLPPVDEKVLHTCFMEGDGPEDYFTQVNAGYWDGKARNLPGKPAMKYDDSNDWEPCSHWMPLPEPPEVK